MEWELLYRVVLLIQRHDPKLVSVEMGEGEAMLISGSEGPARSVRLEEIGGLGREGFVSDCPDLTQTVSHTGPV